MWKKSIQREWIGKNKRKVKMLVNKVFIGEPCIPNASCSLTSLTVSAAVRLIPSPPARVLNRNTKMSFLKKGGEEHVRRKRNNAMWK